MESYFWWWQVVGSVDCRTAVRWRWEATIVEYALHGSGNDIVYYLPYIRRKLQFSRYPAVRTYYIASWVLLKPSALSGCSLAAYVSATVSSSGGVPSGNIVSPHNVRM